MNFSAATDRPARLPSIRRRGALVAVALLALLSAVVGASHQPSGGVKALNQGSGGVVLDGWGGVHPFGGVSFANLNTYGAPYWPGWDIARAAAVLPDGSGGWTLDGWGGVHAWGAAPVARTSPSAYWQGWDIARSLAVLPNGSGGWVLDGWGGIHPWGTAPALSGAPYWPGWDIARGLDIHYNGSGAPDGGWVLDGWGNIHAFGGAPAMNSGHSYPGFDIFRHLHVVPGGAYLVGSWGLVEQVGQPAGLNYSGMQSWGSWNIARDVVPLNPSGASVSAPVDRAGVASAMALLHSVDRNQRGLGWLGESGTLDSIAGNGDSYNLGLCGGPTQLIADRTLDMYSRNYFGHPIAGCAGTHYVFSTYMQTAGVHYRQAGENIAWRVGDTSALDDVWATNAMWEASPEHLANMMGPYSQIGCGLSHSSNGSYQGASGEVWVWACEFLG